MMIRVLLQEYDRKAMLLIALQSEKAGTSKFEALPDDLQKSVEEMGLSKAAESPAPSGASVTKPPAPVQATKPMRTGAKRSNYRFVLRFS